MSYTSEKTFLPGPQVDKRYGISSRTRARWRANPNLGFPEPAVINGREFYQIDLLEIWEQSRAAPSANRKAA